MPLLCIAPRPCVGEEPLGASSACSELAWIDERELDAGRDPCRKRRLIGIDDRVGKAADARDDRHAAIAQAVELGQPAGLEARRDEDRIGAALEEMRERLVIADDDADAARMPRGRGGEAALRARASPEPSRASRPPEATMRVERIDQKVHALLPGQPADDAEERSVVRVEAEALLRARACSPRRWPSFAAAKVRGEMRVGRRVPDIGVDAVDDAGQTPRRARSRPSSPMPPSGVQISSA